MSTRIEARPRWAGLAAPFRVAASLTQALLRERMGRLLPLAAVLFGIALLLMLLTTMSPIAPFLYPLF